MRARELIRLPKVITDDGKWESGKMPRSAFPLSKSGNKAYRLGNRRWRVVRFTIGAAECRLLINYHPALAQFQAMFGIIDAVGDTKVLAALEFHPTHDSWHAHVACGDIVSVPSGVKRGAWVNRLCGKGKAYQRGCPNTDNEAYQRAATFFRMGARAGGMFG